MGRQELRQMDGVQRSQATLHHTRHHEHCAGSQCYLPSVRLRGGGLHQDLAAQLSIIVIIKCFVVKYVLVIIMFICRTFFDKRKCTFYIYSIAESIGLNDIPSKMYTYLKPLTIILPM